jgi:hypothetical protein
MITSELRALTKEGLEIFRSWLDRAEDKIPKRRTSEPPPTEMLTDDRYSSPVGFGGPLLQRRFDRKYDLGMEVCRALGRENAEKIMNMPNVWSWLSLFFYETAFPRDKEARWFTGERSRHLVQTIQGRKQDQSHRHLVKSAVTNVLRFGEYAVVLMGTEIGQSKIEEQVMSRRVYQPLAYHKAFVKALHWLYWDAEADDLKSGARSEGPGSIMHMMDLLTQFDLTFDISSLEADDFMRLLPKDFSKFRSEEGKPSTSRAPRRSWLQRLRGDSGETLTP